MAERSFHFKHHLEFTGWVEANSVSGFDGKGKRERYVHKEALGSYWSHDRVDDILKSCQPPVFVNIKDIRARFLATFSVLVYISRGNDSKIQYIERFVEYNIDDENLPHLGTKHIPEVFADTPDGKDTFKELDEKRWRFCPVTFGPHMVQKRRLDTRAILPIAAVEDLPLQGGSSTTKKVTLQPSSGLQVPGNTVVLKEYRPLDSDSGINEAEAYIAYNNRRLPPDLLLGYYGSFFQDGKFVLILEYADHGSLLQFFREDRPPHDADELVAFWLASCRLLVGLQAIHNNDQRARIVLSGTHQDLKPANIFVFSDPNSAYPIRFKIGDFDLAHVGKSNGKASGLVSPDRGSGRMYGPPELCKHDPDLGSLDLGYSWQDDIWSLGCVFVEAALWTVCGERGREEFRKARESATSKIKDLQDAGYSACFHDGSRRLSAIDDTVKKFLGRRRIFDDLTGPLTQVVLDHMLIPSGQGRSHAVSIFRLFKDILDIDHNALTSNSAGERGVDGWLSRSIPASEVIPTSVEPAAPGPSGPHRSPPSQELYLHPYPLGISRSGMHHHAPAPASNRPLQPQPRQRKASWEELRRYSDAGQASTLAEEASSSQANKNSSRNHASRRTGAPIGSPDREASPGGWSQAYQIDGPTSKSEFPRQKMVNPRKYPETSIDQVLTWKYQKKSGLVKDLPGMKEVLGQISNRTQYFLIDNSSSMSPHWDNVSKTFEGLAYIIKSEGLEVRFTSAPAVPHQDMKTTKLTQLVRQTPRSGTCNMENALVTLLNNVLSGILEPTAPRHGFFGSANPQRSRKGAKIYVFTDGLWGGETNGSTGSLAPYSPVGDVFRCIQDIVTRLKSKGVGRTTVSIQFIRFGTEERGKMCLKYLDNEIGKAVGWDIVDAKSHKNSVWAMLIGSTDPSVDLESDSDANSE